MSNCDKAIGTNDGSGKTVRRARSLVAAAVLAGGAVAAMPAFAQTAPQVSPADAAAREAERIQREQDLRRQQEQQQNLQSTRPPTTIEAPQPANPTPALGAGCRDIKTIELLGVTKLTAAEQRRLGAPFLGKCLGTTEIERLLAAITKAYIDRGFATARAYVPGQDLSGGRLQILILEGRVSRVEFQNGRHLQDRANVATAFPGVEGDTLNLRDLEQGIDQINRLQSHNAALDLKPGQQPGDSIVVIRDHARLPLRINLTADNYGVTATGRTQAGATVSLDSPLGLNDFLTYTRRQSYVSGLPDGRNSSDSDSVFYSVPYGYVMLSGGYSASRYRTFVAAPLTVLALTGSSHAGFGRVDWVIRRTASGQTAASATITVKSTDNFINGTHLDVSSRTLAILDLGLSKTFRVGRGFANVSAGYSRGLAALGALRDPAGLPDDAPRAQFDKFVAGAGYVYGFTALGRYASLSTNVTGQYALEPLYGTEQITAGSIFSVRGFYRGFLANDSGLVMRNDASISLPIARVGRQPITLRPYAGIDVGGVDGKVAGTPRGVLGGAAAGVTATLGPVLADAFVAHPLFKPRIVQEDGFNVFFRVSATF